MVQLLKDTDKLARHEFCRDRLEKLKNYEFNDRLIFSDETTFQVSRKVNKHSTCMRSIENSHVTLEYVQDFTKVNVICAMSKKYVYRPFFFEEAKINGEGHFNMLENWKLVA